MKNNEPKPRREMREELYYIKNGYSGNAIIWWAENSGGYTTDIRKAGKYTKEQAKKICLRPEDTAYLCSYIDNNVAAQKVVIDSQYLRKPDIKGLSR